MSSQWLQGQTQQIDDAVCSFFNKVTHQLSGAVSSPMAGPLAAWMPPSSLQGWIHGVSRKR
ncbi:hypothetical protein WKH86_14205 [Xanthomonas oryzae pv. oryzae]|uniref:Uncharacterized protein n=1 Tax=Xanthomonas oryzae pv. oryzae (strain KACC10331 / KXO85) TaxID=291331 RepID=Q5H4G8_XANOR|nr:hypothetical protein [Xanthomonas oryzae]AAW74153.1 conserved hypothetical protein [Xanthomonas oryzae pv. oryzae KACC 10331]AXM41327.1 hypothetical protein BRN51_21125 [Xanthomonas oryzae pv. oryzae]MDI9071789.1 hypothetical protein [Xanthomonas oryzae pv. oryzae]MDI9078604.1 hypothetical protein [Xanthomonas oryzae pv. oryzae]MDI9104579.1 hypothetical protein [Xanthomonas oryzae pv. oryzae]